MPLDCPKLYTLDEAVAIRNQISGNQKFVLTNGCFDLLHTGHIYALQEASKFGNLWVAINSDSSVRALKGPARPIVPQNERAYSLSALACVSGVIIFDSPRLDKEILALRPDIYVKSSDYSIEKLDPQERNALETVHAKIYFTPRLPGFSTTDLIRKIVATYRD